MVSERFTLHICSRKSRTADKVDQRNTQTRTIIWRSDGILFTFIVVPAVYNSSSRVSATKTAAAANEIALNLEKNINFQWHS